MSKQSKVWYINHYAGGPGLGRAYRPYMLAKELQQQGVSLEVITASYHHLIQDQTAKFSQPEQFDPSVNFKFLPTPEYQGNGLGRLKNSLAFAWQLLSLRKAKNAPSSIVYSSPHLFGIVSAWYLAKRFKAKLILEVRDIWPLSLVEIAGVSARHPIVKVFGLIEWLAYRLVDHRVALLEGANKHFAKVCSKVKPFTWIPNGADLNLQTAEQLPQQLQQKLDWYKEQGYLILGYAGALGEPNAMAQFIAAMAKAKQQKVALLILGEGLQKAQLVAQAKQLKLNNVEFFEPVVKEQALLFISKIDVAVIGWQDKPIYQYGISPNKIFDYMLCQKPILHACSSPYDPVVKAESGISVPAGDVQALAQAISTFANSDKTQMQTFAKNGYRYLSQVHDIKKLAKKYKEVFNL